MATIEQLEFALINADKAGDVEAATTLAAEIRRMRPAEAEPKGGIVQGAGNLAAGLVRGAGSIGATLLAPIDMAKDAIDGKGLSLESNRQRRADMDSALEGMGAQPDSWMYQGGKLAGEIAGTAGAGGVLANGVRAVTGGGKVATAVAEGLRTGGFRVGEMASTKAGAALRVGTGAVTGGVSAGMVNPEDAPTGAAIGGALPAAVRVAGKAGSAIKEGFSKILGQASPEVRALALRAEELGIKIPADRLVDSRTLNAMGESLNYVPLSGRTATEDAMNSQLNKAVSRTFGQDSANVTMSLRLAGDKLGGKFDEFLRANSVKVDAAFMDELAEAANRASSELGTDGASVIGKQVDEIISKAATGEIEGKAAYNIKKTLDRIGKRNSPEAWYALDLKGKLMDALNRSVGEEKASGFAQLRRQYGNMLALEKLAKNGVEGEISAARLANLQNINNPELQELADIAAQFVKPREGAHGAAQRVYGAGGAGVTAGLAALGVPGAAAIATGAGAIMGAGRAANKALNSSAMRNAILNPATAAPEAAMGAITQNVQRALPVAGAAALGGAMAADAAEPDAPAPMPPTPISAAPAADPITLIASAQNVDEAIQGAMAAVAEPGPALMAQAPMVEPEPVIIERAPDPVASSPGGPEQPIDSWYGRRGNGYTAPGDAVMAMRTRQKVQPDLDWRVESMPNGLYRLAGYARPEALMDAQQPFNVTQNESGTALVTGDEEAVRAMLQQRGITSFVRTPNGFLVGRSQAPMALQG